MSSFLVEAFLMQNQLIVVSLAVSLRTCITKYPFTTVELEFTYTYIPFFTLKFPIHTKEVQ